jgi:N-acetyl-anhydromuramyl-L-alanine amidase AmpD
MNEQEMTEMQLSALIKLIGYCIKKYNLSIETLASHKDFSSQTSCPGKNLYKYLENGFIKAEVKKLAK